MNSKSSKNIKLYFKGMAMGIADAFPGISGGTMALILGVYKELVNSISIINFSLFIDAGRKYGAADKPAIPRLLAEMLSKGTANKTTSELEEAIQSLGSSISIRNDVEGTYISGFTLSKNFNKTINILKEILTNPRWDQKEFELLKIKVIELLIKILN